MVFVPFWFGSFCKYWISVNENTYRANRANLRYHKTKCFYSFTMNSQLKLNYSMLGQKMPLFLRYWAGENCFQWCSQAMSPACLLTLQPKYWKHLTLVVQRSPPWCNFNLVSHIHTSHAAVLWLHFSWKTYKSWQTKGNIFG